jgi:hypothetical protein
MTSSAVLLREVAVQVRDVSSSGCLLESPSQLAVGTIGMLDVEVAGAHRVEWFRVCRVHAGSGGRLFLFGAEFLPFSAAGRDSLRGSLSQLAGGAPGLPVASGRSSADRRNTTAELSRPRVRKVHEPAASMPESVESSRNVVEFARHGLSRAGGSVVAGESPDTHGSRVFLDENEKEKEKDV